VLLEALEDYGGTLIFVSHDRYFVEKLATKIIEVGHGEAIVYPGTYKEFLWHREHPEEKVTSQKSEVTSQKSHVRSQRTEARRTSALPRAPQQRPPQSEALSRDARKAAEAERRRTQRADEALQKRIADLESRIAEREAKVKELEAAMAVTGFYDDRAAATEVIDRHQALMWEVGDLMAQWEALQEHAAGQSPES
jgi:ATP-binding cassette subfamily F protein 3